MDKKTGDQTYDEEIIIDNIEEIDDLQYSRTSLVPVFQNVRVTKKDYSIFELHRKYNKTPQQLILEVDFQRRNVWSPKQKNELIESVLMGLPLPIFYFKQQDNATIAVVDGKQRLSTLFDFIDNSFALKDLQILSFLNGRYFKDLVGEYGVYQTQLEDYQVYSHVILPPTPDNILFDIFDRVNRGGTKLNKQEIRNALYHGPGLDSISKITKSPMFEKATGITFKKDKRMKGSYLVTRYLAFSLYFGGLLKKDGEPYVYNGDVDDLIRASLLYMNNSSDERIAKFVAETEQLLSISYTLFGPGAFRREFSTSRPVNMNVFETVMFLASKIKDSYYGQEDFIRTKMHAIITSSAFIDSIENGRDNPSQVEKRFGLIKSFSNEVMK